MSNNGVRISRRSWEVNITTTRGAYILGIYWTSVNNVRPEEVGMRAIKLFKANDDVSAYDFLAEVNYKYPSLDESVA